MVEDTDSPLNYETVDPDLERLKKKSAQGAMNIIGDFLGNSEIKQVILHKLALPLVIVVCLLFGVLGLCDVAKQLLGLNWQVEAIISLIFITIGLSYLAKNVFTGTKDGD
jgi:hypothetical protein